MSLSSACDTPDLPPVQLPVDTALPMRSVSMFVLMAIPTAPNVRLAAGLASFAAASLACERTALRNTSASMSPANRTVLLP